jgi:hypothetical protein
MTTLPPPKGWTTAQIEILRWNFAAGETIADCAMRVGKSYAATHGCIRRLDLRRDEPQLAHEAAPREAPSVVRTQPPRRWSGLHAHLSRIAEDRRPRITLAGPAWSVPAGCRAVGRAG